MSQAWLVGVFSSPASLDRFDDVRERRMGAKSGQQVDVVGYAADRNQRSSLLSHTSAKERIEVAAQF